MKILRSSAPTRLHGFTSHNELCENVKSNMGAHGLQEILDSGLAVC
jgi:hypothetical protein